MLATNNQVINIGISRDAENLTEMRPVTLLCNTALMLHLHYMGKLTTKKNNLYFYCTLNQFNHTAVLETKSHMNTLQETPIMTSALFPHSNFHMM